MSNFFISNKAKIADSVLIYPFTYIGENVFIDENTIIYPFVCILRNTKIGKNCRIFPGALIGFDGFGYEKKGGEYFFIPHNGWVIIEDNVDIGPNVTIALAKEGETRIGKGTKIDALVHIGHNVKIGKNCIIIAQVGIGGSAKIGDNCILAGQVGIRDHCEIGDNSIIYAKSAVFKSVPKNS
ncbi:MAG: UDP-3-O-(3-hydroxymyristoyl)glucosamine N-acyltransferase, partial [candidate division WOR-3 bacterium]